QLAESAVLAGVGGGLGSLVAWATVRAIAGLSTIPLPGFSRLGLDANGLAFTLALMLLAITILGLAPAFGATRLSLLSELKQGVRGSTRASSRRLNGAFVIAQVTMAVVLLSGAGLLLESLRNLLAVDPGFHAEHVWSGRMALPNEAYPSEARVMG